MAAGVAVISTTAGAAPEVITHEHSGIIIPPDDPTALRHAITRLLNSPDLRTRLAHNARQHLRQHLSPEASIAPLLQLLPRP